MTLPSNKQNKILIILVLTTLITTGCTFSWSKKNIVNFDCDKFHPICGENSVTYFNHCQAEDFEIETKYEGPCTGVIEVIPYNVPATAN